MSFLPSDFSVPLSVETDSFRIRPLTIHDAFRDYDAVMSSQKYLWTIFGQTWGWPRPDHTIEQNIIDLGWHHKEFQRKSSFAYTVVNLQETRTLGCVYIDPPSDFNIDADICFWVRQSELASEFEASLEKRLYSWLVSAWPFSRIRLNGQTIQLRKL